MRSIYHHIISLGLIFFIQSTLVYFFDQFYGKYKLYERWEDEKMKLNFFNLTFGCHIFAMQITYVKHHDDLSKYFIHWRQNLSFWTNQMVKFIIHIFSWYLLFFIIVTKLYDLPYKVRIQIEWLDYPIWNRIIAFVTCRVNFVFEKSPSFQ